MEVVIFSRDEFERWQGDSNRWLAEQREAWKDEGYILSEEPPPLPVIVFAGNMNKKVQEWGWSASRSVDDPDYPVLVSPSGIVTKLPRVVLGPRADEIAEAVVKILNRED